MNIKPGSPSDLIRSRPETGENADDNYLLADDIDDLVGICGPEAVFAALQIALLINQYGPDAVCDETLTVLQAEDWLARDQQPTAPATRTSHPHQPEGDTTMTATKTSPDIEALAREMFPAEYAAITDDHPMDPAKVRAVQIELARRRPIIALNDLATAVQQHIPEQPLSRWGDRPLPLEITFNGNDEDSGPCWTMRFVTAIKSGRRTWGHACEPTLDAALQEARQIQRRSS